MIDCPTDAIGRDARGEVIHPRGPLHRLRELREGVPLGEHPDGTRKATAYPYPTVAVKCDLCKGIDGGPACVACVPDAGDRANRSERSARRAAHPERRPKTTEPNRGADRSAMALERQAARACPSAARACMALDGPRMPRRAWARHAPDGAVDEWSPCRSLVVLLVGYAAGKRAGTAGEAAWASSSGAVALRRASSRSAAWQRRRREPRRGPPASNARWSAHDAMRSRSSRARLALRSRASSRAPSHASSGTASCPRSSLADREDRREDLRGAIGQERARKNALREGAPTLPAIDPRPRGPDRVRRTVARRGEGARSAGSTL